MARPDFGMIHTELTGSGVQMKARAIAPGLTLHDLVGIYTNAVDQAEPGDELSGNPSKWPVVRGVKAVADAILEAVYAEPEPVISQPTAVLVEREAGAILGDPQSEGASAE